MPLGNDKLQGRLTKPLHKGPIYALVQVGSRAVTGSADGTIRVWDPGLNCLHRTLTVPSEAVRCILEMDNRKVASAGSGSRLRVHDLETGQVGREFEVSKCRGMFALHRVNLELIASGGGDGVVQLWDTREANASISFHSHTDRINSLCCSGFNIYSASEDCSVRMFDLRRPAVPQILSKSHPVTVLTLVGGNLLTCSSAVELEGWKGSLEVSGRVKVAKYWENKKWLALGDGQGEVRVYHVR